MKVTFKSWGNNLASSRYRAMIPAQELHKLGIEQGTDWLVIGKHGWDWSLYTKGFDKICFDVCDDHFGTKHEMHYQRAIEDADLVTCNSEAMAGIIEQQTGKQAIVIPDPYEQREREPRVHDKLLWFGHASNLEDISPWVDLPNLEVVTNLNRPSFTPWSQEEMDRAFERSGLVIIPTGKSLAKSGNRAIESLRRGLFVVAGYLPAYADLGIYVGDIGEGVQWALSHREEVGRRIRASQDYIREEYSPQRIAQLWLKALN